jgi:hypothetical protein
MGPSEYYASVVLGTASLRARALALAPVVVAAALVLAAVPAHAGDPPPAPPMAPAPAASVSPTEKAADAGTPKAEAPTVEEVAIQRSVSLVPETVPVVKPVEGYFRRWMCGRDQCLAPFWKDSDLRLHLRTFYFDRHNPDASINEAWALGGWLQYTSGWFRNVFQVGATVYTSQPLYAPEDHDGTSLLAPGQDPITVLGQAYGRLRWCDLAVLTVYRQSVNDGYIGPQDNRMIPNTFEGVTLHGKVCAVEYDAGYLWDMKPRNFDHFIPMGEQAGVKGSDEGLWYGSLLWAPSDHFEGFAGDYFTPNVFNTLFLQGKAKCKVARCTKAEAGVQVTDQRSVGDETLGNFETWNFGAGARLVWDSGLTLGAAFHVTGEDANIRSPYGTWPGWLSLIETDFDRAGEKAFGVGLRYDFGKCCHPLYIPGLLAVLAYARGTDRRNPATGAGLPNTGEFDLDLTYDVQRVKGLQFRFRNAYVDSGGPDTGYQIRLIANWEVDLW